MADVNVAVDFVLRQEDRRLTGMITGAANDRGGRTRFGLAERFHPELTAIGFYDDMPNEQAMHIAEHSYEQDYGVPLRLEEIEDQQKANCLLSFAILEGTHEAVALVQRALVSLGASISVDGKCGPATVSALNATEPPAFFARERELEFAYFDHIAAVNPSQLEWVNGWKNRAIEDTPQVAAATA